MLMPAFAKAIVVSLATLPDNDAPSIHDFTVERQLVSRGRENQISESLTGTMPSAIPTREELAHREVTTAIRSTPGAHGPLAYVGVIRPLASVGALVDLARRVSRPAGRLACPSRGDAALGPA